MGLLHMIVLLWVILSSLSVLLKLLGCLWVICIYIRGLYKAWQPKSSIQALSYSNGNWYIRVKDNKIPVTIERPAFFCPWLLILQFKDSQRNTYACLLTNDILTSSQASLIRIFANLSLNQSGQTKKRSSFAR